jgi:tetratricopeptide (TPR) repeat protein
MRAIIACLIVLGVAMGCAGNFKPMVKTNVLKRITDNLAIGVEEYGKGNYENARGFLEEALQLAYSVDNIDEQISAMVNLAELHMAFKNLTEASNYLFTAENLSIVTESKKYLFQLHISIGKFWNTVGQVDKAIDFYQRALNDTKSELQQAIVYNNLGIIYRKNGDDENALNTLEIAQKINKMYGISDNLADNYYNIGEIYRKQQKWDGAFRYYQLALENDKLVENSVGIIEDLIKLAMVSYEMDETESTALYLDRALKVAQGIKHDKYAEAIVKLMKKYALIEATKSLISDKPLDKPFKPVDTQLDIVTEIDTIESGTNQLIGTN